MRRWTGWVMTGLMALALTACGGGGDEAAADVQALEATTPVVSQMASVIVADAGHTVLIRNSTTGVLSGYPLQIGQPFSPGEVKQVPQLVLSGQRVATQAEVQQRWGDGSVRYAVLSAVLPNLARNGMIRLGFGDQSTPASATRTVAVLLAQFPELEAKLNFSANGVSHSASLREMLGANLYQWVAQGPLRYSLLVADHSGRSRDFGLDSSAIKPLRPVFYLDMWPTLGKARVRAVVESPNLDALKDVRYAVTLQSGKTKPATLWSKAVVTHYFGSRWSKTFWVGGAPPREVNILHSVKSLAKTGLIPNMDDNYAEALAGVPGWVDTMARRDTDIYGSGLWTQYMPTTGHREDLGHMPAWMAAWLKTGDWRMRELALQQADLAGAWPVNFREHDAKLFFDRAHKLPATGHPLSLNAHPSLWFPDNNGYFAGEISRITDAGGFGGWIFDAAHQPSPYAEPYLLTGDPYYLDGLQLWAASQALNGTPGAYGRGLDGYGGLQDQVRGNAWAMRSRALAATLSPDGSPEKIYFYQLMDDMIAVWAGQRGVADAYLSRHPNYQWATTAKDYLGTPVAFKWSPLRYWVTPGTTEDSPWQEWFLLAEMGFVRDLGFAVNNLMAAYAPVLIGQITTPGFNPRYVATYRQRPIDLSGNWLTTWPAVGQMLETSYPDWAKGAVDSFALRGAPTYAIAAATAASYLTVYPNGPATWAWLKANAYDVMSYGGEFNAWRVLPRTSPTPKPPRPVGL